jgi:DNA-binding transcriptional MerR regulator
VGALQSPERNGRVAVYREAHLRRLRLIAQLQDRGLRLKAIPDALRHVQRSRMSLEEWLGAGEELRTPWSQEAQALLTEAQLRNRLSDRPPGVLAALIRARLVRRQGEGFPATYLVPSPGLLDITLALHAAGVSIETSAEAADLVRKRMRRSAVDLVRHFARRKGKGFARSASPRDVAESLTALRSHGAEAVRVMFAQEIERALREAFEKGSLPAPPTRGRRGSRRGAG